MHKAPYRIRSIPLPFQVKCDCPSSMATLPQPNNTETTKSHQGLQRSTNNTDLIHTQELQDNSDESDFDSEQPAPISVPPVEPDDIQPAADTASDSDEEPIVPAPAEPRLPTSRSTRVRRAPVTFKPQARQSSSTTVTTSFYKSSVRPLKPQA